MNGEVNVYCERCVSPKSLTQPCRCSDAAHVGHTVILGSKKMNNSLVAVYVTARVCVHMYRDQVRRCDSSEETAPCCHHGNRQEATEVCVSL